MKRFISYLINMIKEEYKFILVLIFIFIIFEYPLDYYIIVGGGSSDVSSRINVYNKYDSKGSFNISYVEELKGSVWTYLLSYIIPSWERENANLYKYSDNESIDDIEFRGNLDLLTSNSNATYWAYTLSNKEIKKIDSKIYIITIFDDFNTLLKVGDQILSINGNSYDTIEEYRDYMQTLKENEIVNVRVLRKNKEKEIKTKLYKYQDRLILGVGLQLLNEYETNPSVNIKFKNSESGPSGGLITTLEIYNQLTKNDLTNGKKIVGTGTILEDGSIGEIGGVKYKLLGASKDKADYFLVPDGNYKEAVKYKKKHNLKVKLIKVKNIKEIIEKLNEL